MVKCLLTTFMDPLFNRTPNTPSLKAEFALANAPSNLLGRWTLTVNILQTAALWSWQRGCAAGGFLKRPTLQRCGDWDFSISIVESHHQSHSGFVCVNVFEFERDPDENCIALRMPFYSSEDLMEFSEGFDGKCWSSYWNLWILNAVFGILVYRSTFIGWIYSDSETLDKTTFFFFTLSCIWQKLLCRVTQHSI